MKNLDTLIKQQKVIWDIAEFVFTHGWWKLEENALEITMRYVLVGDLKRSHYLEGILDV